MIVNSTLIVMIVVVLISLCIFAPIVSATTTEEWNEQGCRFLESGDCEKAIECFDKAIGLNPNYTDAYLNRGLAYWYLKHDERALEDFEKVIKLNPCSDLACRALNALSGIKQENGDAAKTATPTLTPTLTIIHTVPQPEATPAPAEKDKEAEYPIPGFEPKFALAGLLSVAYIVLYLRRLSHN
jgi:tetratricopeptide (TPR) repeat protein